MSWLFSQVLVAASSAASSTAGTALAPWSVKRIPVGFLPHARTTVFSLLSRFGRTCARSHPPTTPSAALSAGCAPSATTSSSPAVSPVRTSVAPAPARDSTAPVPAFGPNSPASLAKYDPETRSWKTAQCLLFEASTASLETFARWGTMQNGALYPRPMPSGLTALREAITRLSTTSANASGFTPRAPTPNLPNGGRAGDTGRTAPICTSDKEWAEMTFRAGKAKRGRSRPFTIRKADAERGGRGDLARLNTPTAQDAKNNGSPSQLDRDSLNAQVGGSLNPEWVEWLQGWPIGWTDLKPLATDRFQQWFNSQRRF